MSLTGYRLFEWDARLLKRNVAMVFYRLEKKVKEIEVHDE